jgi:phosphoribosylaminoimidazole-succinocarboxamide synthase
MSGQASRITSLPLLAQGKMRDLHAVDERLLLMVASDRLSAFDVVMAQPLPGKGALLTRMSNFWFGKLASVCPNHLTGIDPEAVVAADERPLVRGRAAVVKRLRPILVEAVVRGFLAGSGWQEYQARGSVCGVPLPPGLRRFERLAQPIFTPVQKAPAGEHDRNITFAELERLVGADLARRIERASIALYLEASAHAQSRGILIADTKFEFGLDADGTLTLMDEVLTPDSSRFWPVQTYRAGVAAPGFDKQLLRDWLEQARVGGRPWDKRAPAPAVPQAVLEQTLAVYQEAFERLCS